MKRKNLFQYFRHLRDRGGVAFEKAGDYFLDFLGESGNALME
jgi:hypothetical protein